MRVLKIGGNELSNEAFRNRLAETIAVMRTDEPVVIVHGGGRAIADLHTALGLPTIKVDGLRVTSARSLELAEMVLSGHANKLLVRSLLAAGVDALGLSGVDGGLIQARKKIHPDADLGFVGEVEAVRGELLQQLLTGGSTPVVSPISHSMSGQSYNVNADDAATAIAVAVQATMFDFVSNVPGVLHNDAVVESLTTDEAEQMIASGVVYGGMIPKVRAALRAVERGVSQARIVNLDGLQGAGGTIFRAV